MPHAAMYESHALYIIRKSYTPSNIILIIYVFMLNYYISIFLLGYPWLGFYSLQLALISHSLIIYSAYHNSYTIIIIAR